MNIDDLCDLIRQRRKRTGLTWRITPIFGRLRENSDANCCPLTAGCLEATKIEYDENHYAEAAVEIGFEGDPSLVANAADNDRIFSGEVEYIRAKLLAACTGPLE